MAKPTPILLKRRVLGVDPAIGQLAEGELGYAYDSDKLFIGGPLAGSVLPIGGASFITLLTATPGTATADKAVILDSNTKIDVWNVAGRVEADTFKTSASVNAGFVKNDGSGNFLFGQTGEQTDLFLDNLADVDTTGIATGKHLIFDGTNWVPVANDLIGLADTPPDYSGAANLYLRVDSGASFVDFVSISLSDLPAIALDDLANVNVSSPTLGNHLEFDGSDWIAAVPSGGVSALDDLTDVTITSLATDDNLRFNGSQWVNETDLKASIWRFNTAFGEIFDVNNNIMMDFGTATVTGIENFIRIRNATQGGAPTIGGASGIAGDSNVSLIIETRGDGASGVANIIFGSRQGVPFNPLARFLISSGGNALDFQLDKTNSAMFYGTNNVDGTWKVVRDGDDLAFQRRESNVYVEKGKFTAASFFTSGNITAIGTITGANFVGIQASDLPASGYDLDELGDVDATTPADGQVLTFVNASGNWEAVAPSSGGGDIGDLDDVDIVPFPNLGSVLQFNNVSGNWESSTNLILEENSSVNWGRNADDGTWRLNRAGISEADLVFFKRLSGGYRNTFVLGAVENSVNWLRVDNAATGDGPVLSTRGSDTNIDMVFATKGTGKFQLQPDGTNPDAGLLGVDSNGRILFNQSGGGASALDDLSDVTLTTETTNDVLAFDGADWVNVSSVTLSVVRAARFEGTTSPTLIRSVGDGITFQDAFNNSILELNRVSSAVNFVHIFNAATGNGPEIRSDGGDTNVDLALLAKGTGEVKIASGFDFSVDGGVAKFADDVVITTTTKAYYIGDPTTLGSWRIIRDVGGTEDLLFQELETGPTWVTKGSFAT